MERSSIAAPRALAVSVCATLAVLLSACGGSVTTEPETRGPASDGPRPTVSGTSGTSGNGAGGSSTGGSDGGTDGAAPEVTKNPEATADEGSFNIELHVKVTPEPGAEPKKYILQCDGTTPSDASNVPKPEAACALVEESAHALFFTKPDPTLQCTQQYGGPQTATVTGSVNGRPVEAQFARTDGCEISRWGAMESILGSGGVM